MTTSLVDLTIAEAGRLLRRGEIRSFELTEACLDRIGALEPQINAFITPTPEHAFAAARSADDDFAAGIDHGPLHGIPVAVKDLCATNGVRTTAGSKVLGDWVPDFDATVVAKLKQGGAPILGKLNLHEFAYGTTSNNEFYGPVRNPWNTERHPGGSSGGSGAAVSAGECLGAIGSDTGGSIRIPAALCGVVGLMPTYGLVSRKGVVPLSWTLDHIGPLTRTVEDAALFLNAIAGHDPGDPGSVPSDGFDATSQLGQDIRGLRLGVARSQVTRVQPDMARAFEAAIEVLHHLGAEVHDIELPMLDQGLRLNVLQAEAAAYHQEWLRERPEDYSDQVRAILLYGSTISAVDYLNDLRLRREFTDEIRTSMQELDAIVMPTCMAEATPINDSSYRFADLTSPWDLTGQPVISVPCGFGDEGLPLGISFAGRPFDEARICRIAQAYEQATDWHTRRPPL